MDLLTYIQYIATTTCVEMQWGITFRTVLGLELSNQLVKTCLVRYVCARELQYPLAAQCVFEGFLTDSTLAPNKSALSARPTPVRIHGQVGGRRASRAASA